MSAHLGSSTLLCFPRILTPWDPFLPNTITCKFPKFVSSCLATFDLCLLLRLYVIRRWSIVSLCLSARTRDDRTYSCAQKKPSACCSCLWNGLSLCLSDRWKPFRRHQSGRLSPTQTSSIAVLRSVKACGFRCSEATLTFLAGCKMCLCRSSSRVKALPSESWFAQHNNISFSNLSRRS